MAKYRYIFADLLTDEVTCELPLYGVNFGRRMCKEGPFTGSIGLNTEGLSNRDIINGTQPARTALYIERNDKIIWGGIIWSRTWQEQSKSFQYYGETWESFFATSDIRKSLSYTNVDQRNIVRSLVEQSQFDTNRDLKIDIGPSFPNNIIRSVNFFDYDVWTYRKALDYLAEYNDGLDWYIDTFYDGQGNFAKALRVDNRLGDSIDKTQLIFDFPGTIKNFWFPESGSRGATSALGVGAGEGAKMLRRRVTNQTLLNAGYPDIVEIYTNKDVTTESVLIAKTSQELIINAMPIVTPTYEIYSDRSPEFGSYNLGDHIRVVLDSVRFETPYEAVTRVVGWDVSPTSSSGAETVKIIVAGEEM